MARRDSPIQWAARSIASGATPLTSAARRGFQGSTESIVFWPNLQGDNWKRYAVEHRNIASKARHPGYLGVMHALRPKEEAHVTFKIDADAKREDIEALVAQSQKRSAVYDIVTNPTNVTVKVL